MTKRLLLLFLVSFLGTTAWSETRFLSSKDFKKLSEAEKNLLVVKTMELVVELEAKYARDTRVSGYSQHRFEHYSSLLRDIQNLLLATAHADEKNWESYQDEFANLISASNSPDKCVYAGWVSKIQHLTVAAKGPKRKASKSAYCVHPNYLKKTDPSHKAYIGAKVCPGIDQISCNPAIFGFKKENERSLFCVTAGSENAHNSSLSCMHKALDSGEKQEGDSKEARLLSLTKYLSAKPERLKDVQQFIFKSCVCSEAPAALNTSYHKYMQPHRTCFGLMNMISQSVCEVSPQPFDTKMLVSLKKFVDAKEVMSQLPKNVDGSYKDFLVQVRSEFPTEYLGLCAPGPEGKKSYSCVVNTSSCTPLVNKKKTCNVSAVDTAGKEYPLSESRVEKTIDINFTLKLKNNASESVDCVFSESKVPVSGDGNGEKDGERNPPVTPVVPGNDDKNPPVTPVVPGDGDKNPPVTPVVPGDGDKKPPVTPVVPGDGDKKPPVTPVVPGDDDKIPPVPPTVPGDGDKTPPVVPGDGDKTPNPVIGVGPVTTPTPPTPPAAPVTGTTPPKEEVKPPVADGTRDTTDSSGTSVTLKVEEKDKKTVKATAELENSEGWSITWTKRDIPTEEEKETVKEEEKPKEEKKPDSEKDKKLDGTKTADKKTETKPEEKKAETNAPPAEKFNEENTNPLELEKADKPYEICVTLTKTGTPSPAPGCDTVPALGAPSDTGPVVTLKITPEEKTATLEARPNDKAKDHTLVWTRKGKEIEAAGIKVNYEDEDPKDKEVETSEVLKAAGDGKTLTIKLEEKEFEVCVQPQKDKKDDGKGDCKTVPALEVAKPAVPTVPVIPPFTPPPQVKPNGGFILNGVR
ncbi:MAG TPA: hypothetical protein VNJ01_02320 [Bacteriovoracaceae bacterium]|nr:hypothetical protein [Bacteriovoracaceae bacterium]